MSKVLFLSIPSHGNVNPTLGLVSELVKQGEEIVYFCSEEFKEKIEATGAIFKPYAADLDIFKAGNDKDGNKGGGSFYKIVNSAEEVVDDILYQINDIKFDYIIHSAAFPFAGPIAQLLKLPTVSSLAVFSGVTFFLKKGKMDEKELPPGMGELMQQYRKMATRVSEKYEIAMPDNIFGLLFNKGDIGLIYTSEYFISPEDKAFYDDTYKFVGPPVFERKENLDFPFERLEGKRVIYISLGTVFSNFNNTLYPIFFESFANMPDTMVVMAAYNVDLSPYTIPDNYIVRNYVPQSALLKHTDVAITHAGMNSISDLVHDGVPFVCLPLGADQPLLAKRAQELGATIALDAKELTGAKLNEAVNKVQHDPAYRENMKKINDSFQAAGGYKRAVEEIFKLKEEKGI